MPTYLLRYHGTDIKLPEDRVVVIGRQPDCDVVVNDPAASRRHLTLKVEPEGVWLEDLGSQNGTWLNGQRVEKPSCLKTGDWFRIGRDEFAVRVVWERTRGPITSEEPMPLPKEPATATQRVRAVAEEAFSGEKTQAARATPASPQITAPMPPPGAAPAGRRPGAQTLIMETGGIDPVMSLVRSCKNALTDTGLPMLDRVNGALHLLQALVDMRAEREACELLGEMLDALAKSHTGGFLPPLVAARAHALLGRWWMQVGSEPAWQARAEALRRAEKL